MIELRHLRYFIAVAEELNFRRAAERIHIDQTPLSRTIRDLEQRWGVTLFLRMPRNLRLTPAGVKLLDHSRKLLVRLERTKRAVRAVDVRHREPLRIGVDESAVQPILAKCLASWRRIAPDISLEISDMHATEMRAAINNEGIDLAFSFGLADSGAIAQQPAWTSNLMAILPADHELSDHKELSLGDLLSFPTIGCNEAHNPGLYQQMEAILKHYGVSATIAGESRTLAGYIMQVAAGQGVGIADAAYIRALQREDIVVRPLAEQLHITTYVLHKQHPDGPSETLQRFLTHATTLY
ncbi:LysR substrate-binding domain-containing protein [Acidovorax sp. D2M1]|uniref:LysR substrate-binding domain-containing protein n=1 Tax=Acidovorax benzenivorans TaxID=2987520 RepID=A0ABT5RZZ9_9BURK|nr:LysR substrate-binding domain-containing protein [Acidovorax benzenivorans]MDD2179265.1 LysR substrate-binding domain-containing protein [Acidovorax benzenivorans]